MNITIEIKIAPADYVCDRNNKRCMGTVWLIEEEKVRCTVHLGNIVGRAYYAKAN